MPRSRSLVAAVALILAVPTLAQDKYSETMTVRRVLFTARLVDANGKPILGLEPKDFTVDIAGIPTDVLSVTWVPESPKGRELAGAPDVDQDFLDALAKHDWLPTESRARLFVLYFQTDFARNAVRVRGQMSALRYVDRILDSLNPEDRVAVFSFDSHLRFQLDFTEDKARVREAARRALRIEEPPAPPAVPDPSLAYCLDRNDMRKTARDEQAFKLLARALREIPGEKQMLVVGTRLGEQIGGQTGGPFGRRRSAPGSVVMDREWNEAKQDLVRAGVVINAIYAMEPGTEGALMAGLKVAAAQTGGFFVRASHQGVRRVEEGELTGKYELEVRVPEGLDAGAHAVAIRGAKRKDIVLNGTLNVTETIVKRRVIVPPAK